MQLLDAREVNHRQHISAASCKAHAKINRKVENSTLCKIVTSENFDSKLCTRDYVGATTAVQILVQIGSVGASPQIGEI